MEIGITDQVSIISLLMAFLAYRHSVVSSKETNKQIQEISEEHLRLSSNVALSNASQKYVVMLSEVNKEFEGIVKELSYPALEASRNIGDIFDKFDTKKLGQPYLRHAFHNVITIVREAYDRELTYQTGLNLSDRIRSLKYIKDVVASYEQTQPEKSIFGFLKKQKSPENPEEYINSSVTFWGNVKAIYNRIPSENEPELFKDALSQMAKYRELHEKNRDQLVQLESRLENAIKENALELFDIKDVPNLGQKFYRVKGDIGRYRELYFPDFYNLESVRVQDGIAYSIYAGSILFIASQHFMWGKT